MPSNQKSDQPRGYACKAKAARGEIYLYSDIGKSFWSEGVSAKQFADDVKALGSVTAIDVYINSYGGSVFDGLAMHTTLKRHSARIDVHVDGIAASIASVIAMAGDTITMAANGWMMIHDAWGGVIGTAADMRKTADELDQITGSLLDTYTNRTGADREMIRDLMAAETWLSADQAKNLGFVDVIGVEKQLAAYAGERYRFRHPPDAVVAERGHKYTRQYFEFLSAKAQKLRMSMKNGR